MKLSEHFTLEEATRSSTADRLGINNFEVSFEVLNNAKYIATRMERVRDILGTPIHVDSWIRCLDLNRALHSKDTSKHVQGLAVDFIASSYGTPLDICEALIKYAPEIGYDQLILEHTWVHISFCIPSVQPRGQVLSLLATGEYASGLTNKNGVPYV